ncbi:iron-containing redox enzyme family protein [Nocardiopsis mangrovi]|uniref:Iron-containing redox enzyme family protein n=1 Tax=Nocardiopsis mangrovi TaxID=1179818 RepID=A0ABV9E539_9ACTN
MTIDDAPTRFDALQNTIRNFSATSSYRPSAEPFIRATPYHRPLDAQRLDRVDWASPLAEAEWLSDSGLMANRLLMNVYESDALFLPASGLAGRRREFEDFYHSASRRNAEFAREDAERFVFGFLDSSVRTSGRWDTDALEAHITAAIADATSADRPVLRAIEEAAEPERAAETMIAQMALDGLTEATAMSQNLGGAFGHEQSELFKIFIDEFGYGVFDAKHSTLFAELCRSVGMNTEPHHYWFFYLPAWIAGNNYFYKVTRARTNFFRYIGGMAYLEATFAPSFAAMTKTFRTVYGDDVDTRYFDEHAHIDEHHGRMAVYDLLLPLGRKHGAHAIEEMVRGIEEVRLLGRIGDEDLLAQITWTPEPVDSGTTERAPDGPEFRVDAGSAFETRVADRDTLVTVEAGSAALHWTPTRGPLVLDAGRSVRVPGGRLYGIAPGDGAAVSVAPAAREGR